MKKDIKGPAPLPIHDSFSFCFFFNYSRILINPEYTQVLGRVHSFSYNHALNWDGADMYAHGEERWGTSWMGQQHTPNSPFILHGGIQLVEHVAELLAWP